LLHQWRVGAPSHRDSADDLRLVESRESPYNNIYVYAKGEYVIMTFGHSRQTYSESIYNKSDELDLPLVYMRYMTASLAYTEGLTSVLEIGFGGGRTSSYLHHYLPNVAITAVELDSQIVQLARKYFGLRDEPNVHVAIDDGRLFLGRSKDRYDIILLDAYRGPFVPFHLLTKEFYQIVKDHLAPGGVIAQNIEPATMLFDSAVVTIHSVFSHLDFFEVDGNVVTIAYDGAERGTADLADRAAARQNLLNLRWNLTEMLAKRRPFDSGRTESVDFRADILTDDFAPVETLKAVAVHNRKWADR